MIVKIIGFYCNHIRYNFTIEGKNLQYLKNRHKKAGYSKVTSSVNTLKSTYLPSSKFNAALIELTTASPLLSSILLMIVSDNLLKALITLA